MHLEMPPYSVMTGMTLHLRWLNGVEFLNINDDVSTD
jgi:hypothetical protein